MADKQHIDIKAKDFTFFGWIGENIRGDVLIEKFKRGDTQCQN